MAGGGHNPTSARCSHASSQSPHERPRRDFAEALVSAISHGPERTEKLFPGAVTAHITPPHADACAGAALQAIALHAAQVLRGGGGGGGASHELLMPRWLLGEEVTVPGVGEGGLCKLCGSETAHVAACPGLGAFLVNLFHDVARGLTRHGVPTQVSQHDLHHGHIFLTKGGHLGMLLHTREYPAESEAFPYSLGHCQKGSTVLDPLASTRNVLWLHSAPGQDTGGGAGGRMALLNTEEGSSVTWHLIAPDAGPCGTVYEGFLGAAVCDVTYFDASFGPEAGISDPQAGLSDPETGLFTPEAGLSAPEAGPSCPEAGLYYQEAGLSDPGAGGSTPEAGSCCSEAGLFHPEAGLSVPEAGVSGPEVGLYHLEAGLFHPEAGLSPPAAGVSCSEAGLSYPEAGPCGFETSLSAPKASLSSPQVSVSACEEPSFCRGGARVLLQPFSRGRAEGELRAWVWQALIHCHAGNTGGFRK